MEYERLAWLALLAATWVAGIVGMYLVVGRKHDAALRAQREQETDEPDLHPLVERACDLCFFVNEAETSPKLGVTAAFLRGAQFAKFDGQCFLCYQCKRLLLGAAGRLPDLVAKLEKTQC